MRYVHLAFLTLLCTCVSALQAQRSTESPHSEAKDSIYKRRILEASELQILTSYYTQDGNFAAVTGGKGSEELTDVHPTIIMAIPLNEDDVITAKLGVSVYSSASSSNINPFDGGRANPFQASSGASSGDNWVNGTVTYSHSSDDRRTNWSATVSGSAEYDYTSVGVGGSLSRNFNQQNTELSLKANAFIDGWIRIYPSELRPFGGGDGLNDRLFRRHTISGNPNYAPTFSPIAKSGRQSYNLGITLAQILSKRIQGTLSLDIVQQFGLLSTPFQRVYFADFADSFIEDFHLADDIERLPDSRTRLALGGRLNSYINERIVLRAFYRYYRDTWDINSHTASLEVPVKISPKFTVRPAYRFYTQSPATYFAPYNQHVSTDAFYTSDYDLSGFNANQYSLGISYSDLLAKGKLWRWRIKSIDLNSSFYRRNNGFSATQFAVGIKLIWD